MGLLIAKFRKKKTNLDILENLEEKISSIQDFQKDTEIKQKRIVGRFLIFSCGVYVVATLLFYYYFFPKERKTQILYLVPFAITPSLIYLLKRLLTFYYNRKIRKNEKKLVELRAEKKKILENVMETETFKVARTILEKYASDQIRRVTLPSTEVTPLKQSNMSISRTPDVRNRFPNRLPQTQIKTGPGSFAGIQTPTMRPSINSRTPALPITSMNKSIAGTSTSAQSAQLPRSIIPKERSIFDKMVDYLIGDGPSNRYALICKKCFMHNGMALKEEFEYFSFHCCYCQTFNPARKQRPVGPKLDTTPVKVQQNVTDETSESEKNSPSESSSEDEVPVLEKSSLIEEAVTNQAEPGKASDNEAISDFDKLSDVDAAEEDKEVKVSNSSENLNENEEVKD